MTRNNFLLIHISSSLNGSAKEERVVRSHWVSDSPTLCLDYLSFSRIQMAGGKAGKDSGEAKTKVVSPSESWPAVPGEPDSSTPEI